MLTTCRTCGILFLSEHRLVMIQKLRINYLIQLNYHNSKCMIEIDMRELRYFLSINDISIILKTTENYPRNSFET